MYTLLINVGDMTHDPMTILPPAFTMYNCGVSNETFIAITDVKRFYSTSSSIARQKYLRNKVFWSNVSFNHEKVTP